MLALYHSPGYFSIAEHLRPETAEQPSVGLRGDRRKPVHCASRIPAQRVLDYLDAQVTPNTGVAS